MHVEILIKYLFLDGKKMQLAKNAFEIWKGKKQSSDSLSFNDRKSTTSSMCTMCGNPECKVSYPYHLLR